MLTCSDFMSLSSGLSTTSSFRTARAFSVAAAIETRSILTAKGSRQLPNNGVIHTSRPSHCRPVEESGCRPHTRPLVRCHSCSTCLLGTIYQAQEDLRPDARSKLLRFTGSHGHDLVLIRRSSTWSCFFGGCARGCGPPQRDIGGMNGYYHHLITQGIVVAIDAEESHLLSHGDTLCA